VDEGESLLPNEIRDTTNTRRVKEKDKKREAQKPTKLKNTEKLCGKSRGWGRLEGRGGQEKRSFLPI